MRWLSRVKGYTITELIVAMLISGMVITYAISTSFFVKERYANQTEGYFSTIDFIRVKHDLTRCFEESDEIFLNDSTLVFRFKHAAFVSYLFQDSIIIRKQQSITDTFNIYTTNFYPRLKPETILVSEIHVGVKTKSEVRLSFFKDYPMDIFIRNRMEKPRTIPN